MKLTNDYRTQITKAILAHAFDAKEKALQKECTEFADDMYNIILSKELQETLAKLPKAFLHMEDHLTDLIGYWEKTYIEYDGYSMFKFSSPRPSVIDSYTRGDFIKKALTKDLMDDIKAMEKKVSDFKKLRTEYKTKTEAILRMATTTNKLKEQWPEITTFVDDICQEYTVKPSNQLVCLAEMNKILDLPVETKVEAA